MNLNYDIDINAPHEAYSPVEGMVEISLSITESSNLLKAEFLPNII
jgi:hypothetical protein